MTELSHAEINTSRLCNKTDWGVWNIKQIDDNTFHSSRKKALEREGFLKRKVKCLTTGSSVWSGSRAKLEDDGKPQQRM
jgi:hypothetical protein